MIFIGTGDKTEELIRHTDFRKPLLLIDDGPVAEAFIASIPVRRKPYVLDWRKDGLNPLMQRRAFWDLLPHLFPRTNTLTRDDADFLWLNLLATLDHNAKLTDIAAYLEAREFASSDRYLQQNWKLICDWDLKRYDAASSRVVMQIASILINPVLRNFLTRAPTFPPDKLVIVIIDRAQWGDFDSFTVANFLINYAHGHIIIPDFGFYAREFHITLMRQKRLIAGVNFLSELPHNLQQASLHDSYLVPPCTAEDAERVALYRGLIPGRVEHTQFLQEAVQGL